MPNVRGLFSAQEAEAPPEAVPDENIEEGSRVTRKKPGKYLPDTRIGTVLSVDKYGKCKIKWDTAAATGQWHSTVDKKALKKVKE